MWPHQCDTATSSRASPLPPFTQQPKHSQGLHPKERHLHKAEVHDFCCVSKNWVCFLVYLVGAVLKEQKMRRVGRFSDTHTYCCLTAMPHQSSIFDLNSNVSAIGQNVQKQQLGDISARAVSEVELCCPVCSCFRMSAQPSAFCHIPPHQALPNSLFWVLYYCHKSLLLQTSVCFLQIQYSFYM